jgi:hypothetical protein
MTITEWAHSTHNTETYKALADNWNDCAMGKNQSMADAIRELERSMLELSRLHAYLEMRHGNGCGDQGHMDALKAIDKRQKELRKVLGYIRP